MKTSRPVIIDQIFKKYVQQAQVPEAVLLVESSQDAFTHQAIHGDYSIDHPFLTASLTKLFTTCLILQLVEEGPLKLDDHLEHYLSSQALEGLHTIEGKDASFDLTIRHLLFQTSGLPDIYQEGSSNFSERLLREDFRVSNQERLKLTKNLPAHFKPGAQGKAFYADINFNLLGLVAEQVTQKSLHQLLEQKIFQPLALTQSYLISKVSSNVPTAYYRNKEVERSLFLTEDASSGIVTTARELMIFLKAFYQGQLFKPVILKELESYHDLQAGWAPIRYGGGFMNLSIKRRTTDGVKHYELLGHTGSTGSFAFYCPQLDMFLVGTLQQMARPELTIRFLMNLVMKL